MGTKTVNRDDFRAAARRWYRDGCHLLQDDRYPGASHAFGLAAECALKHSMERLPGAQRELPRRHLPELLNDARLWLSGRRHRGLTQLLGWRDYMHGWRMDTRYWADDCSDAQGCRLFRDHARRTLQAAGVEVAT